MANFAFYSPLQHGKVNYLMKQVCFSLVGNYLGHSNNYRQLININAAVLILIIC